MSQYILPAFNASFTILIGWDAPLDTYFSTVLGNKDGEEIVLLEMGIEEQINCPLELSEALSKGGFCEKLSMGFLEQLYSDKKQNLMHS